MVKIGKKLKGFKGINNITYDEIDKLKYENEDNKTIESEKIKEICKDINIEESNLEELDVYLKNNNVSLLLVLLFYKIINIKPDNPCDFIINELKILKEKSLLKEDSINIENEKENEKNKEININRNINTFLGDNYLTLEDVLNAMNFMKMENENKIYFNNLKKLLDPFQNKKNNKILMKENIKLTDTISLDKASTLITTFYNNYFC